MINLKRKVVTYKSVVHRMLMGQFGLSFEQARKLYAHSKMQVLNEKTHSD